ncbi:exodeoxyribonuclease III [candidate division TA06 bacterium DG_26]|uniref:Exodeoxyribonuclease III n=1 Tax=candidate division TA06 bacterium DG_26 TaxID=1703771 RepID=A0A0S7WMR8_UNCT6|nr:MAG: exodeoxyribonuclease III [candidate division TA06 bacterium DG_26]
MMHTVLISWNVNGLRAILKKGFWEWFGSASPDILCLQEIKVHPELVPQELKSPEGYRVYWSAAERKGYSGVATFSRRPPSRVEYGMGIPEFDREGRILLTEYDDFMLINVYFPNGKMSQERLRYKLDFYEQCLLWLERVRKEGGKGIVLTGDVNTAHNEIDLARPKENSKVSGFLAEEREWIDRLVSHGYVDTFRYLHPDLRDAYTWWDYKTKARERNIGWRIDYFFVSDDLLPEVKRSEILLDVYGSDHCPILLEL